jgi:hypothetical protein
MADFEDFHVVALKELSERTATLLVTAGIRIHKRVITQIGCPEYVIAVHPDDIERASEVFRSDLAPARTFTCDPISET